MIVSPKLAVQAATGATRHTALISLMALQQQLCLEVPDAGDQQIFNSRLSRVVTKLFGKVVKAEENLSKPFATGTMDMESLVCAMDDLLVATKESSNKGLAPESVDACTDLIKVLVESIIKVHGGSTFLRKEIEAVGMDEASMLSMLVSAREEGKTALVEDRAGVASNGKSIEANRVETISESSKKQDAAYLVSALGSSAPGPDRDAALFALRAYKKQHGQRDLDAHLKQVSSPFRAFIQEQLEGDPSPEKQAQMERTSNMSQRLRSLRSRLQATELAVQTTVDDKQTNDDDSRAETMEVQETTDSSEFIAKGPAPSPSRIPSPAGRPSRLAQPSPSKLSFTGAGGSGGGSTSAMSSSSRLAPPNRTSSLPSLRERMALAQESRRSNQQAISSNSSVGSSGSGGGVSTSMSRAAALRARLEAVKQQNK